MLTNQDKKKLGALVGILLASGATIFGIQKVNEKPRSIVDDGTSGQYEESLDDSSIETSRNWTGAVSESSAFETQNAIPQLSYDSMTLPEQSEIERSHVKSGNLVVRPSDSKQEASSKTERKPEQKPEQKPAQQSTKPSPKPQQSTKIAKGSSATGKTPTELPEETIENQPTESERSQKPTGSVSTPAKSTTSDTSLTREQSQSLSIAKASEEEAARVPDTPAAKALTNLPVFDSQRLGNTKVYFYQHPSLSVGLDLRNAKGMSQQLYVFPSKKGFLIFPRQMMSILGLTPETLKEKTEKNEKIPGAISVRLVDAKEKEELEKKDTEKKLHFAEAEGGRFYVIEQTPDKDGRYQNIYDMLDHSLDPKFIADNLTTAGMIGNPPKINDKVTMGEQQKAWEDLVSKMRDNPAVVEYNWNLPLLAPSAGYLKDGKEIRTNIPDSTPNYSFGRLDINNDKTPEYIIHATTKASKDGVAAGYWAILEPTPSGLTVANVIPDGNGDLLLKDNTMILPSLDKNNREVSLCVQEAKLGEKTDRKEMPKVTFRLAEGTGKELAEKYPKSYLVPMNDQVYLFTMEEMDKLLEYIENEMKDVKRIDFIGSVKDGNTGLTNPTGTQEADIQDPIQYLQERYPNLPLTPERLQKATPTSSFKDLNDAVKPSDFDRVENNHN